MVRLGERHSRDWHEKIHSTAQFGCTVVLKVGILNPLFPWDRLNCHTESYLKKKGKIVQGERDKRLQALIQKHGVLHHKEFHVSVAACARFMSPESVRSLLAQNATCDGLNLSPFLQATVAAHHENPLAVTEADSQLAQTLVWFTNSDSATDSQKLETLVKRLIAGIPADSFTYSHVCRFVQKYTVQLAGQVKALKEPGLLLEAHEETVWLSTLLDPSIRSSAGAAKSIELLEGNFPDWRAWAAWQAQDSQLAQALTPRHPPDAAATGQYLKTLIKCLLAGIPIQSLLRSHAHDLARRVSRELAKKLEGLRVSGQWFKAHKEAECLSILLEPSSESSLLYAEVVGILEEGFADWRPWAEWRPDVYRLRWQKKLTDLQRCSLLELLALEGPDFEVSKQATMGKGLLALYSPFRTSQLCWGNIRMDVKRGDEYDAPDMVDRLLKVVEAACRVGSNSIELLIHLCCSSKPIDNKALKILEGNHCVRNTLVTVDVLYILKVEEKERSLEVAAVMRLLPALSSYSGRTLREALAPCLVERISTCMQKMQALLRKQLDIRRLVMQLHAFGEGLQAAPWLLPLLDVPLGTLIRNWPTAEKIADMNALQSSVRQASSSRATSLSLQLNEYYRECLIEAGTMDPKTKGIVEPLVSLWHQNVFSEDKRAIALTIAQGEGKGSCIRRDCLKQLSTLSDEFVRDLRRILEGSIKEPCGSCVSLARLFARSFFPDHKDVACWSSVLYHWLVEQDSALFEYTLTALTINDWHQWLSDLHLVFANLDPENPRTRPKVLRPALHAWTENISEYSTTIQQVESILGSGHPTQCFRVGFESTYANEILQILALLKHELIDWDKGGTLQPAVRASMALLKRDGNNAMELQNALSWLAKSTTDVGDFYSSIIETHQGSSPEVAQALLFCWLQNPELTIRDKLGLEILCDLLGILYTEKDSDVKAWLENKCIMDRVAALIAEAQRLSDPRRSLKIKDPEGTSTLSTEPGIGDISPVEDEIGSLPHELADVIEVVGEDVVNLHFPLTHHTTLQRAGMGTTNARSLIVRLFTGNISLPAGFCMHLDNGSRAPASSRGHNPLLVLVKGSDGGNASCHGQVNRATYQLGHILSRHLLDGLKSLEETYKTLKLSLDNMSDVCIVCESPHGVKLLRSYRCQDLACYEAYFQSNLCNSLHELREDAQVADLLLTAVQAAVTRPKMALLPGWSTSNYDSIFGILNNLPSIATLSTSDYLHAALEPSDGSSLALLKWIFDQYGGFLVSATGHMDIPSMRGAHQFLLASAAPHLEEAFAAKKGTGSITVVFHGTSLGRLYSILCQGLQIRSGGSLQRKGAKLGRGIYVAEDPKRSWHYASQYRGLNAGRVRNSSKFSNHHASPNAARGWNSGTFDNFHVLLACEASGIVPGQNVHVITDPSRLILRYIFLTPHGMNAPLATDIVPEISRVFALLHTGAI